MEKNPLQEDQRAAYQRASKEWKGNKTQWKTLKSQTEKLLFCGGYKAAYMLEELKCDIGGGSQNSNAIKGAAAGQVVANGKYHFLQQDLLPNFPPTKCSD